jgi:hypothetical protein
MFIDPLMWVCKQYGRGTDVFGVAHILLLLLFGLRAAHSPPLPSGPDAKLPSRTEEFNAICLNRQALRDTLRTDVDRALTHTEHPLSRRWRDCPRPLLHLLMTQVGACGAAWRLTRLLQLSAAATSTLHSLMSPPFNFWAFSVPVDLITVAATNATDQFTATHSEPAHHTLCTQAALSTTAGEDGLQRRPTSRNLLTDLSTIRSSLPPELAALIPTPLHLVRGHWPAVCVTSTPCAAATHLVPTHARGVGVNNGNGNGGGGSSVQHYHPYAHGHQHHGQQGHVGAAPLGAGAAYHNHTAGYNGNATAVGVAVARRGM